jgi:hypothetical protein
VDGTVVLGSADRKIAMAVSVAKLYPKAGDVLARHWGKIEVK